MKSELRWLFPIFLFFSLITQAVSREVEVRLTSPKLQPITPGRILTGSFLVSNNTERDEEFVEEIESPPGWHKISPVADPFVVKAKGTEVRLLAFSVPATAPAGLFEVPYLVRSRRDYALADSGGFSAQVLAVGRLELLVEDKPQPVIAGEDYSLKLRVINRGNSRTSLKLLIKSVPDYPVSFGPAVLPLEAGSSENLRLNVKTDEALRTRLTHIVTINAVAESPAGDSNVQATVSVATDIIPKITGEPDPYHRLPARLRFMAAQDEGNQPGLQAEFSGTGSLDEQGRRRIDFLFRGPDLQDQSIYGTRDEYRVSYFDKFFNVHVGDRNYALSPLTERYGYGRGAEVNIAPGPFGVGAFYMQSRWRREDFSETGAYVQKQFTPAFSVRGNFLHKDGSSSFLTNAVPAHIYSIQPQIDLGERLKLDFEYGRSQARGSPKAADDAWRIEAKGQLLGKLTYSVEKVRAGTDFYGYYNDSDATFAAVTVPVYGKLRSTFSLNQHENNLSLNPNKGPIANRETIYRPGLFYTFPFRTDVSLEYQNIRRADRLLPAAYDFEEQSVRLGVGHSFGKISVQTFTEQGEVDNHLSTKASGPLERYSVYVYYRPTPRQSYSVYARVGDGSYTATPEKSHSFGGAANWNIADRLSFNVQYARNSYDSGLNRVQDVASSTVTYTFPNQHHIALSGRWSRNSISKESETAVFVAYTIPLSLPVGKKKSVGVLKGRVFDAENGKMPVARVVLRANDLTAVTDRNGEFLFPSLEPGMHLLHIEQNSIGLERVTTEALPFMVDVRKGTMTRLDIGVVRSARLSAKLAVFGPATRPVAASQNQPFDIIPANNIVQAFQPVAPLEGCLVELSNGKEILRHVTDKRGEVSFQHLRPGKWTCKVDETALPPHHYVKNPETQIELKPGDRQETTIEIWPRQRRIQLIDQGIIK